MRLLQLDTAEVNLITSKKALELKWRKRVSLQEMQAVYIALLQQMKQHAITRLLLDFRECGKPADEAENWTAQYFIPRIMSEIGLNICLAYLLTENHYKWLQSQTLNDTLENLSELIRINNFLSRSEAEAWLGTGKCSSSAQ